MQLRYSWNEAMDDAVVRQVNARFAAHMCYPALAASKWATSCYSVLLYCVAV